MNEQRPLGAAPPLPSIRPNGINPTAPAPAPARPKIPGAPSDDELASMELIETPAAPGAVPTASKIRKMADLQLHKDDLHRPTNVTHTGATRVKTFIGKVSQQGMDYLDHLINVWLDQHPEIEVKHVTSTFGKLDGKVEHAMIVSVWY
jgi:hypothetical protein